MLPTTGFPSWILTEADVFGLRNEDVEIPSRVILLNLYPRFSTTYLQPSSQLAVEVNRETVKTMHKFGPSSTTGKGSGDSG